MIVAKVIDVGALLQVVWVSIVAATLLTIGASVAIASAARAGTERRAGRTGAANGWTALAAACTAVCCAAVVVGVMVMLHK